MPNKGDSIEREVVGFLLGCGRWSKLITDSNWSKKVEVGWSKHRVTHVNRKCSMKLSIVRATIRRGGNCFLFYLDETQSSIEGQIGASLKFYSVLKSLVSAGRPRGCIETCNYKTEIEVNGFRFSHAIDRILRQRIRVIVFHISADCTAWFVFNI